jgi:hypothetical protein
MKSVRGLWSDNFLREILREEGQTLNRSTCNDCGASAVAKKISEKILRWERSHMCAENPGRRSSGSSAVVTR